MEWNSFCMIVDKSLGIVSIDINGHFINTCLGKENLNIFESNLGYEIKVGLFPGEVTDVNIWNSSLSAPELFQYSQGIA